MTTALPYVALRAFEMVVRKANFSAAADELGVSQSAVSQHVKMLEDWLGESLLERGARHSRATREGLILARAVAEGLGRIQEVCSDIRRAKFKNQGLVVSCPAGFAFTWLFPRLLEFDLAHPDVAISITTDSNGAGGLPDHVDVGVHYGLGDCPGLHVEHLMSEKVFPVCAPGLMPGAGEGRAAVADLANLTLLIDELSNRGGTPPTWEFWARECEITMPPATRTRQFSQSNLVTQAAIQGLGVAMGREPLVIDALVSGQLVRPFPDVALSQYSYWLVCPHTARTRPHTKDFIKWIKTAAAQRPTLE